MCGRFTLSASEAEIKEYLYQTYQIANWDEPYLPRYNIAPSQNILSIIFDGTNYRAGFLKWGFIPYFSKSANEFAMINAKAETLMEKPAFKNSLISKRCLIVTDGFYEWKKEENKKIPMRFTLKETKIFVLAGLYSIFTKDDGQKLSTCAIITTKANPLMALIHNRMPVILHEEAGKLWLNPKADDSITKLLLPFPEEEMTAYEVSTVVNNPANDSIQCIKPMLRIE